MKRLYIKVTEKQYEELVKDALDNNIHHNTYIKLKLFPNDKEANIIAKTTSSIIKRIKDMDSGVFHIRDLVNKKDDITHLSNIGKYIAEYKERLKIHEIGKCEKILLYKKMSPNEYKLKILYGSQEEDAL